MAKAGNKSAQWSAGIAGAVTYNELENTTSASLRESTVTGAKKVAVQGLAAGLQVSVALGVAVNASADQDKAASAAGSVSISDVSNKVESAIEDSAVEGPAAGPDRVLDVIAYDRTTIGTGGGSLIVGGKRRIRRCGDLQQHSQHCRRTHQTALHHCLRFCSGSWFDCL